MRHVRMLGLCLAAVFAVAGLAAATASAGLPEWGRCEEKAGGKYANSNCTTKAAKGKGLYEWKKGTEVNPVKFSGENVGSGGVLTSTLEQCSPYHVIPRSQCEGGVEGGLKVAIECESEHNVGEAVGSNGLKNITVKFRGCKLFGSVPCGNGAVEGEIVVNPLKGTLGYINKADKTVGVLLEPAKKHGEFVRFNCGNPGAGGLTTVVGVGNTKEGAFYSPEKTGGYDGIISPITPVDTPTSTYEQVYTVNPETHENIPSKFEGKHIELLETYTFSTEEPSTASLWAASGEEITNKNTAESEGEIKA